jgi:tRNA/rRNA methyltransferase
MNGQRSLARVRVVLCRPSHPGNIGAAARAMKTMGLSRLYLVRPRAFPHADADARAAGAAELLAAAVVCDRLEDALVGTRLAAAMTARRRDLAPPARAPRAAAAELLGAAAQGEVALVFGSESSGLNNDELALCQIPVTIPANPDYTSLNLASAVQVLCYELRLAAAEPPPAAAADEEFATFEDVERFHAYVEQVVIESGFLDPRHPGRLMARLRRLFARARLEREEINILRGLLNSLTKKVDRKTRVF